MAAGLGGSYGADTGHSPNRQTGYNYFITGKGVTGPFSSMGAAKKAYDPKTHGEDATIGAHHPDGKPVTPSNFAG